ncbi:MAG: DUF1565 domain-containing protein [Candidatus Moranbacteria bacterium]|nr:DUF1565 domain-containing protein [Candidatus Moranbacteria bacterium]
MEIKLKKILIVLMVVFVFWRLAFNTEAKDYDYYVDQSVKESGDGSEEDPFDSIEEAIDELDGKSGDIFVKKGTYSENLIIKKGVKLFGESQNDTIISGEIKLEDETAIYDLTVKDGKTTVKIMADSDAEIQNCTIKEFLSIGIEAVGEGGNLKINDSRIGPSKGKGVYVKKGKGIEITNCKISDNEQEGVDIRANVEGFLSGNTIEDNDESGIELIVGSTELKITNNQIKNNGSSGIAAQFYENNDKKGNVIVMNNTISNNDKYGFDCNKPQGGKSGSSYWNDSIEISGNTISANKQSSINDSCNIIRALDEEEKNENTIDEEGYEDNGRQKEFTQLIAEIPIDPFAYLNQTTGQETEKQVNPEEASQEKEVLLLGKIENEQEDPAELSKEKILKNNSDDKNKWILLAIIIVTLTLISGFVLYYKKKKQKTFVFFK